MKITGPYAHVDPDDPLLEIPEFLRRTPGEVKPAPTSEPQQEPALEWDPVSSAKAKRRRLRRGASQSVLAAIKGGADTMQKLKSALPDHEPGIIRSGLKILLGQNQRSKLPAQIEMEGRRYKLKGVRR